MRPSIVSQQTDQESVKPNPPAGGQVLRVLLEETEAASTSSKLLREQIGFSAKSFYRLMFQNKATENL